MFTMVVSHLEAALMCRCPLLNCHRTPVVCRTRPFRVIGTISQATPIKRNLVCAPVRRRQKKICPLDGVSEQGGGRMVRVTARPDLPDRDRTAAERTDTLLVTRELANNE